MGREVAEATKPDDFYKASTRETGAILSGTKALAFVTNPGRARNEATNGLRHPTLGPGHAGTAERIVAIRDCGAECGLRGIWVSGALGGDRKVRKQISGGGVRRPCIKFILLHVQTSIVPIRHFLLIPRNARSH